jgi:hypothetical protein
MKCSEAQRLIFRQIDRELPGRDSELLGKHLSQCSDCARDFQLLSIPQRVAPAIKPIEPSDFFCQTLRTRIENEARNAIVVQQFLGLARGFIPSLAAVTLALLSIFAYLHLTNPRDDLYAAYKNAFVGEDLHLRAMISEQQSITDANILSALANRESWQYSGYEPK